MNGSYEFILKSNNETNATNGIQYIDEDEFDSPFKLSKFAMITFIIAGTIGNLLVCLAILLDRKLQNLTNYFLLSLAVTDLIICLLIWPCSLIKELGEKLNLSTLPWYLLYFVGYAFFTYASAIHISFISFERYLAIRDPFNQKNHTKRRVTVKIGLVWFFAFLAVIPLITLDIMIFNLRLPAMLKELLSLINFLDVILFINATVIGIILVVVVLSLVLTTILLLKLVEKQKKNMALGNSGLARTVGGITTDDKLKNTKLSQGLHSEQKALRVVWLITFAFIICWAPSTYIPMYFYNYDVPVVFKHLAYYLNCFFPVVNPIVYTILNLTKRLEMILKTLYFLNLRKANS